MLSIIHGTEFFVRRSGYINKSALLGSLNKLFTVHRSIVKHIVIELKKTGYI